MEQTGKAQKTETRWTTEEGPLPESREQNTYNGNHAKCEEATDEKLFPMGESAWQNSLGMKFLVLPGRAVFFFY